jgi:hypothetical protein
MNNIRSIPAALGLLAWLSFMISGVGTGAFELKDAAQDAATELLN